MFCHSKNVMVSGGTFQQITQIRGSNGIELLQNASAPGALYNSGERFDSPKCHPNTRIAVLNKLMDWIMGKINQDKLIFWLYGAAGAGKSAIGQTLAKICAEQGNPLLATFFFSRSIPGRNTSARLMATLAYQVALAVPEARPHIEMTVELNPMIFDQSLDAQLSQLILDPLLQTSLPEDMTRVIIIDGLDECDEPNIQCHILETISNTLSRHSQVPLRFLILSRPEPHIKAIFNSQPVSSLTTRLALDDAYNPNADILLFLRDSFATIKHNHPLSSTIPLIWPEPRVLTALTKKASGQFIYASTVIKYISSIRHRPMDRVGVVLGLQPPRKSGGDRDRDIPFAELDALYMYILSSVDDITTTRQILSVLFVLNGLPQGEKGAVCAASKVHRMDALLSLSPGDTMICLNDLTAVIQHGKADEDGDIHILHASLGDFLLDPARSQQFYINRNEVLVEFARLGLRHIRLDRGDDMSLEAGVAYGYVPRCLNCVPTPELKQDLWNLSLSSIMKPHWRFWGFATNLLLALKNPHFEDLYSYHLKTFDQLVTAVLSKYDAHFLNLPSAIALSTLSFTNPPSAGAFCVFGKQVKPVSLISAWHHLLDLRVSKGSSNPLLQILGYPNSWTPFVEVGCQSTMYDFFTDQKRSGRFCLKENTYTSGALHCLRFLCFRVFLLEDDDRTSWATLPSERFLMHPGGVNGIHLALYFTPLLLEKASTSGEEAEDLISFIRDVDLKYKYPQTGWVDDAVDAVCDAIDAYLTRCEASLDGTWSCVLM